MSIQSRTNHSGCYEKAVHFAEKYISPHTLEKIEASLVHSSACIPFIMGALSQVSHDNDSNEFSAPSLNQVCAGTALIAGGMAVGMIAMMQFNKWIKTPFIKREIAKAIESSKHAPKSLLVFQTTLDPLGAFSTHVEASRYRQLANTHKIDVLSSDNDSILSLKMKQNREKYDMMVVKSHSDSETISLTRKFLLNTSSTKNMEWFKDHIKEGGIIALECCEAGKGEENIAKKLSKACPHAYVYASSEDIDVVDGIYYDKDGNPSFNNGICGKGKDTTRLYRNGRLEYSVSS